MDEGRVPKYYLIGEERQKFNIAIQTLDGERIGITRQALGITATSIDCEVKYVLERNVFDKPISEL